MHGEPRSTATKLREGMPVEVATHFTGSWTGGFEVVALHSVGCRVRRVSDGAVLPIDFDYLEVRPGPAPPPMMTRSARSIVTRKVGNDDDEG
jgi:hypothetical protein